MALAIKSVNAFEAQNLRGALSGLIAAAVLDLGNAGAGIDLLHPPVGPHCLGRTGHQHFALVHHRDILRKAEHAIDVVLDDQYRNVGGDVLDQVRYPFALGGGKASQRLVEQQHLRLGTERNAEVDQPLPAIGQFAAFDLLDAFETEKFYQLGGFGVHIRIAVNVAPDIETHRMLRLQRQPKIFVDREFAEQIGDLKRTRQTAVTDQLGRHALNFPAVEADS